MHDENGRHYRLLGYFWGISPAMLAIVNILSGAKLVQLGPIDLGVITLPSIVLAGGTVLFPIAYVFDDIITETYGFAYSQRIIWTAFFIQIFGFFAIPFVGALPGPDFLGPEGIAAQQSAYNTVLGSVPLINCASLAAVLCGRYVNSWVLAKMKEPKKGKNSNDGMFARFVVSTIAGEAIDTFLFLGIAFGFRNTPSELLTMYISQYTFKVLWEVVAFSFFTKPVVNAIKRIEKVDHYGIEPDPDEGI